MQELLADLQELWPLQALMPAQWTLSALAGVAVRLTAPPNNMAAAVAARVAPVILRIEVMELPPELRFSVYRSLPEMVAFPTSGAKSPLCEKVNSSAVAPAKGGLYVRKTVYICM